MLIQINITPDVVEGILGANNFQGQLTPVEDLSGVKYGWILPNGDFYQCLYYQHALLARDILESKKIDEQNPESYADKHGWIKIGKTADGTIFIGTTKHLTDEQKNTLGLWGRINDINPSEFIQ